MKLSQKNEPFEEPPRAEIPASTRQHVQAMVASDSDAVWVGAGMRNVLLRTLGQRSGREHTVALPYWLDEGGHRIVVASFAGAPDHPAWFHNIASTSANPEVLVREKQHAYWSAAEILDADDYQRIWSELTADRPFYRDYQTRCERRIPLVRLPETRPA